MKVHLGGFVFCLIDKCDYSEKSAESNGGFHIIQDPVSRVSKSDGSWISRRRNRDKRILPLLFASKG